MQDSNSENFYNQDSSFSNRSFLFLNQLITKKELEELLLWMFRNYGIKKTCILTELLKEAGFNYATQGGLSIGLEDLKVPRSKSSLVSSTNKELAMGETQYKRGELTGSEWFQKQVMAWNLTSEIVKNEIIEFFEKTDPLNPLYIMTFSGARGNLSQVRQLIGMRGLMSDQKGQMIGSAIQKNFREGLTVVDFLISSYGARKGLVDTAIRTADSGYMTRRLVDIAQDVIIRQFDCQARTGILILQSKPYSSFNKKSFSDRLIGKVLAKPIIDPKLKCLVAHRGQEIDFSLAHKIHELGIEIISVRSPLTCQSYRSICQTCFGWDLTQHKLIELGEAVGIIAAQSIGEPGTQLTMRTFHTGGVFSRELSQQIRSNYSGQIEFADNLKTQFIRTNQGDYAQIVRNTSFFEIRTYKNEQIRVAVERDDLLLVKNKSFIRKGQPIVQSASAMEDSDIEVQKTISTKFAGEIYYQPRQSYNFFEYNIIVWILAGILITLPFETKKFTRAYKPNSLVFGRIKLTIKSNPFTEKIFVFNQKIIALMCSFKKLKNFKILSFQYILKKDKKLLLLQHEKNNLVFLKKNLNQKNLQYVNGYIGRCATTAYKIQMSGNFYPILSSGFPARSRLNTWIEITKGGMYAWVPEESYKQLANNYSKEKQGNFVKKNLWLGYNCFSPLHGLVEQKKQVRKINELVIHSGVIFNLKEENVNLDKLYEKFAGQFFFPGEILFNKLKLNRVFYAQVFKNSVSIKVIFKPITIYSIPKSHRDYPIGHNLNSLNNELVLKLKRFLTLKPNEHLKANLECSKQIVQNGFFIENINPSTIQTFDILTNLRKVSESKWSLEVGRFQNFHNLNINPRRLNTQTIKKISSVRPGQVLEPYSLAGYCDIYENIKALPLDSKTQYSSRYQSQELLILSNTHIRELYFDEVLLSQYKKKFLFAGDSLFNSLVLGIGGKVLNFDASKLRFRIGKPYLFTEGAKVYKNHKDFAPENTILGFVSYRVFKTQDIIQGLPKVEEILEARGSSERAKIAEKTGLVTKILNYGQSNQVEVLSHIKQAKAICEIPYLIDEPKKEALDVEPYQYIGIADKFHKGLIDPQHLLDIFFDYYRQRDSHHKATLRSLYRLASMFIKSIQSVYESQGIQIVDRHLEIIVRQMIIKAKVEYAGETPLVAGEYLDIQQLVTLNKMLQSRNKVLVYYKPVVLGLTKAALTTESFLSAASFQETVRILTQAAIEGKVDWLRGLKEKVIIGGLIPSGTGILSFLDEWITKHIFLYGRSVVSTKTRRKFLRKKLEHQANQLFINSGEENYETYK